MRGHDTVHIWFEGLFNWQWKITHNRGPHSFPTEQHGSAMTKLRAAKRALKNREEGATLSLVVLPR